MDKVIMGAGMDLETRLQIVNHIFEASDSTTVHLKLPFVTSILRGFDG
jgi:hypothetical protein